ncbi:tenascin-like [Pecten maximus]|uniref:tenascin-like n=1 Tax=Pecten maximus TaxID=6579 RepID=UPI001459154F|nr:tenascin-like [Pecten maximus]
MDFYVRDDTRMNPNALQNVTVKGQTTSSVTLTITSPSSGSVDYYNVTFTNADGQSKTQSTPNNDTSYTVDNLTAGHRYTFSVVSVYQDLTSTPSTDVSTSTVPNIPSALAVTYRTTTSVTLTVTPGNGGHDGYRVTYVGDGINRNRTFPNKKINRPTLVIGNLTSGTTFTFNVFTRANGLESESYYGTQASTNPNALQNVTVKGQTTSSVTLTITSPSSGSVDYYNVTFTNADGQSKTQSTTNNDTSYTVDNLTAGHRYTFSVVSVYQNLTSTPSRDVSTSTVPNRPTALAVTNRTPTSVTLTVTPGYGGRDGYRVSYNGGDNHGNRTFTNITNDTPTLVISSLTSGTTFTFNVFTRANGLECEDFYGIQASTNPNALENVTVNNQTTSSVTLTITSPSSGSVDYYNVTFTDADGQSETRSTPNNDTSYTVDNLTAGHGYTFSVVSVYQGLTSTPYLGVSTSTVPNPPGNVTVNNQTMSSVTLAITAPSSGSVDYYNVTFTGADGQSKTRSTLNNDTSYTVDNLTAGHGYTFSVVSVYQGLTSTPSTDVSTSTVPAVPEMSGYSTTNNTITVTLTSNGSVDGYIASEYCVSSDDIRPSVSTTTTAVTITGLNPGSTCDLTVVAVFTGLNSSVAYFSGLSVNESNPGPVGNLSAQTLSSTAISVTWNKPSQSNGNITQYSVYVTDHEGRCVHLLQLCTTQCTATQPPRTCDITRSNTFTDDQTDFNETIDGLLAYIRYTFTVYAYTLAGQGAESSTASNTSQSEPHYITDLVKENTTSSTITISFHEPEPSTGPITRYQVRYVYKERVCKDGLSNGDDITQNTSCIPSSGRTVCSIHHLYPYWNYSISVRAYTIIGPGNWSDPLLQRPDEDKPTVIDVDSLHPTLVTAGSVTLEWSAPCPPNGVIGNYLIHWNTSSTINTSDSSMSYTIPGLQPYRNYTYQVAAVTGAGVGSYTSVKTVTTLTDVPHKPSEVNASTVNSTRISVTWNKPDLKTGPTSYTATAIDENTQKSTSSCTTTGFESTTCMIGNLDEYWNYTIVVIATTVNGSVNSSNNKTVTTAQADTVLWWGKFWFLILRYTSTPTVPGNVTDLHVSVESDVTKARTVNVTCNPPVVRDLNGKITGYTLEWGYNKASQVFASTSVGNGLESSKHHDIPSGAPLIKPNSQASIKLGSSSAVSDPEKQFRVDFDVNLVCNKENGIITDHYVFVSEADESNTGEAGKPFQGTKVSFTNKRLNIYRTWSAVKDADSITPYIASRSWHPCPNGKYTF